MRVIVISMENGLLSRAIEKYLRERGELMPETVTDFKKKDEPYASCKALSADILLMDVAKMPHNTLERRLETAQRVKETLPGCKIALLCDDNADPDTAERVKDAKKLDLIDSFFHSSVTGEYLSAALDAL